MQISAKFRTGADMRRKAYTQLPLRRVLFLQQPWHIRALICAIMYFEDNYNEPQQARYLGVSVGTISKYINLFFEIDTDFEDYAIARERIEQMRSKLLFGTHW